MSEFKDIREKYERFKFDALYYSQEYTVNAIYPKVFFPIGSRNAFTGVIVNNGTAIVTITLVKISHAEGSSQSSDVGQITLAPGQVLKLTNYPVQEIIAEYNPNSLANTQSIIQVKGVIHPLFEAPVGLEIQDVITLQKQNEEVLITGSTSINGGVYDTIIVSAGVTLTIDDFVVAKKVIVEPSGSLTVNGTLVADKIDSEGQITINGYLIVREMYYDYSNISGNGYLIADKIIFSAQTQAIMVSYTYASYIKVLKDPSDPPASVYEITSFTNIITAGKIFGELEIPHFGKIKGGFTLSISLINNSLPPNANINFLTNGILELENAPRDIKILISSTSSTPPQIMLYIKGNAIIDSFSSWLYTIMYLEPDETGQANILINNVSFNNSAYIYVRQGVTAILNNASFSSSYKYSITTDGVLYISTKNISSTSSTSSTALTISLPFPNYAINGFGVAIIAYQSNMSNYKGGYLQGNIIQASGLSLAPGTASSNTASGTGISPIFYLTAVQGSKPGLYYIGFEDTSSTEYVAEIVIYVGTINQYNLNNPYGFTAIGSVTDTSGHNIAIFNSSSSAGTITITGLVGV